MNIKGFLKYVEIQTKLASVIPFIFGTVYTLYRYDNFRIKNFLFMFISLICFDMATTAINNYCDYKKAQEHGGYNYEIGNAIETFNIKISTAKAIIAVLLTLAVGFGVILTLNTNIIVLIIGAISFAAGILYTFGPIPISRMPLGEIFSGLFMGFIITFLSIYIHVYDAGILSLLYSDGILTININLLEIVTIFLISIPLINGIANIMLANNICDVEEDIVNKRFTLPYYIGKKNALKLFGTLYYIGFVDIACLAILKIVPVTCLIALLTLIPVKKDIEIFTNKPSKSETFSLAVKNFAIMNLAYIITALIAVLINIIK